MGPAVEHFEYLLSGKNAPEGFSLRFERGDKQATSGEAFLGGFPATVWCCGEPVVVTVSGTSGAGHGAWQFRSGNLPATYAADGRSPSSA